MAPSELDMTPPDSPKAIPEETTDAPTEDVEEDLLADLFPKAPPHDRSSIFYDREYWSTYKVPPEATFHAQNGEPKSPRAREAARERWLRVKGLCGSNCCA